ncbi:MAG: hypothetical protein HC916_10175 [Coleofasciculaceae cyanobacterium SM2_1_6]|nr:hypothetical protein [Coleofasciculaceae cyanobacterium SM2_1_6]
MRTLFLELRLLFEKLLRIYNRPKLLKHPLRQTPQPCPKGNPVFGKITQISENSDLPEKS